MRKRVLGAFMAGLLGALGVAAATAPAAAAADIPGWPKSKATLPISLTLRRGVRERPGDSDWYRVPVGEKQPVRVYLRGSDPAWRAVLVARFGDGRSMSRATTSTDEDGNVPATGPETFPGSKEYRISHVPLSRLPVWAVLAGPSSPGRPGIPTPSPTR